ncbi:general transcription factor IIH subunit 1 [Cimex lectularius]|uniref:General transcription factor IIH subunit 1 n=1 Tax=Cimex lectularius TaxID=79782 RepID=A0A8I6RSE5_CIMLE|nr:general transcription factor IIH subunit 1 [Cimex lectularius]
MTSKSEDVLLQVSQVKYKKGDGTLYLMSERLAWILDHKDTVSVSHRYADIKLQKISPEGKPKIQLQVVLHDNTTSTFQFVSRQGTSAAIKERDKVKDLLVNLLPKFKRKVNKELEEKNRLMMENPGLLQLYKDLVMTEVVTSEEFWARHATSYLNKDDYAKQQVGVSGAFLADIKPQTDGCNGLKYNLTPDVMEAVFRTYPAVRQKHREAVPHRMTESQFWTKFFQSHYFHRDRINAGTKDLFTDCAKIDDQVMSKAMVEGVEDPLVDIGSFEDANIDECYGNSNDVKGQTQNIVHQSMIKRFNQHSIMVLKACQNNPTVNTAQNASPLKTGNGTAVMNGEKSPPSKMRNQVEEVSTKKRRIQEKIMYEDLEGNDDQSKTTFIKLKMAHVGGYFQGPSAAEESSIQPVTEAELPLLAQAVNRVKEEVAMFPLHSVNHSLVPPATAVAALGELTPGGALMKSHHNDSLAQLVSDNLAKEVRGLYCSICELLRHFWACFPPTTPELQTKTEHLHQALRRFHNVKLKPFENKVMIEFSPLTQQLTNHLNQLLETAYNKYDIWQSRRKQLPNIGLR